MKAPLSWLKEWVAVRAGAEEIAKRLTFAGLEVEGIQESEGEPVLEVNVTPNRGDCLSIRGLARELAALYGLPLKTPFKKSAFKTASKPTISVSVNRPKACPRYALAVIDGVRVGPSPEWLVRRLAQSGIRSVNNVVDVTNFVLLELGHPLHAFDRAKIRGGKIAVRNARAGETLKTLDGVDRKLEADDLVIADAEGTLALAGVMGGANSEVEASTAAVALECAFFDPSTVRRAARRLGLSSESSYRFERRVDPEGIPEALERAVGLILKTAGGHLISVVNLYKEKMTPSRVRFRPADVEAVLGGKWTEKEIRSSLQRLGFRVKSGAKGEWRVTAPSSRGDVSRPVDLIEEVARLQGLDRIPEKFPPLVSPVSPGTDLSAERRVKAFLTGSGLQETIHYSFVAPEMASVLGDSTVVSLANPLSQDESVLRPSLLPSLLSAASLHARHKMDTFRAFELRKVFSAGDGDRPTERKKLAGLLMGDRLRSHWSDGAHGVDFYDLKGVVEGVLDVLSLRSKSVFARGGLLPLSYLHPGQQARVLVDGKDSGCLGEAHPNLLARFDLKKVAYVFELDWEAVACLPVQAPRFKEYPRTPVVERDLALVVEDKVEAGVLLDFIRGRDSVIADARVFDLYRGDQVASGKKSLAFSIRMSRPDRTLTDEEINEVFQKVIEGVRKQFGAEVR
jgi:phenylalanyl-tRNA synthetase beta chain